MAKKVLFLDDSKSILKTITFTVTELVESGVIAIQTCSDSEAFAQSLQDGTIADMTS
jgi:hypothetical protein